VIRKTLWFMIKLVQLMLELIQILIYLLVAASPFLYLAWLAWMVTPH
jgi:hypothetical protein